MTTDVVPKARAPSESLDGPPQQVSRPGGHQASIAPRRRWAPVLLGLGVVAILASATVVNSGSIFSPEDPGPKLTHTITRGDLRVAEQTFVDDLMARIGRQKAWVERVAPAPRAAHPRLQNA